ncbi:MAG TPA: acyl-CoA dehydrogenase family protein [Polyangia bacterium]|jgi:acyl-CoA dehydrogenase family protein 9
MVPSAPQFAKSLFFGLIPEDLIFPFPHSAAAGMHDALRLFLDSIRRFGQSHIDSRRIDDEARIPRDVIQGLRALGLFGTVVPEEYGGGGLNTASFCRVMQELAGIDASVALTVGAHQTVGLRGLLLFGTEEQKRRYLPRLASGEWLAAYALTEPEAGSDAASIRTRAEPSADGSHFVISGRKQWITNGGVADLVTVFAKTPVEHAGRRRDRITAFLVERGMGLQSGSEEDKLGIRGSSLTSIYLDGVRVPRENILGEIGQGFKIAMEILNAGRLSLSAGCVGMGRRIVALAVDHAKARRQFGQAIAEFGMIRSKFAQMAVDLFGAESMVYLTAGIIDGGVPDFGIEAACCKVFASEMLWRVANEALQVCAGAGYMRAYPYERFLRDARINLIFNGTNEILRLFISLGGMSAPGEKLAELSTVIRRPIGSYTVLAEFLMQKLRTTVYGERISRAHPLLRAEASVVEDFVIELEQIVERALRKHGGRVVEMQHIHRRVADMVIDIYALIACIARTSTLLETRGVAGAASATRLCRAFSQQAHVRLRRNLRGLQAGEDEAQAEIAEELYGAGGYELDVLD